MQNNTGLNQKIFRYIFWIGYLIVLFTSFLPIAGSYNRIELGPESFRIRLDHLLHLSVYFLICMFYMIGLQEGLELFDSRSMQKFLLVTIFLAAVTEVVQLWIPARAFNFVDLTANLSGLLTGGFVIYFVRRSSSNQR